MFGKVKGDSIYTGTLKVCLNINDYEKYGDSRFVPFVKINNVVDGEVVYNTEVIEDGVILIKVSDNVFVTLDDAVKNGFLKSKRINTFPLKNGDRFIDKKSIVPYFSEINNDNSRVALKTLVKKNNEASK